MKVKIGPFISWIGPYQIAEKLVFWKSKYDEKYGKNDTAYKFGNWLAEDKDGNPTRLANFCEWVHSKRKRTVKIHIDKYDVWNMDGTLSMIIYPMLLKLREIKHGSPRVDMEDVPENLRCAVPSEENDYNDETIHKRWEWVLDEMIWAFEQEQPDCDWEDQYGQGEIDHKMVPSEYDNLGNPVLYTMEHGPKHTYKCDYEAMIKHDERIQNGLRLFGKYYRGLWD